MNRRAFLSGGAAAAVLPGRRFPPREVPAMRFTRVARTAPEGFPLVNGTPVILAWTAPADGRPHSFLVQFRMMNTLQQAGGKVVMVFGGSDQVINLNAGSEPGTDHMNETGNTWLAMPGEVITVQQIEPLTEGDGTVFCEIWAG
jgi:hypothetical protein